MSRTRTLAGIAAAAAAAVVAERKLVAAPRYHGPVTDHFDGERFHNVHPGWQTERSFLKWQMTKEPGYWPEWVESQPGPPPPQRAVDGRLRVTFINHATLLIQMDGVNILTDPIWSDRCSPVQFAGPRRHRAPGIQFRDLPAIDVVLVSHNHYDHLDIRTLHRLQWRFHPRVVTPLGNGALMRRNGIRGATELDWWQTTDQRFPADHAAPERRVAITAVPSQHFCARGLSDRNRNLWGGFVVSGASGNAYFAGDTGWGDHFAGIAAHFGSIRVALLPIGAYMPRWFMRPAHIDPLEAVEAHRVLGARTTIPMHYGTFALGDDGEQQPLIDLRRALAANDEPAVRILEHGEGIDVA